MTLCPCNTPLTNRHPHAFHKDGIHVRVCSTRCLDRMIEVKGDAFPACPTVATSEAVTMQNIKAKLL